jgi:two-component system cell cycle response regulator
MKILLLEPDAYYHARFLESLGAVAELLIEPDALRWESLLRDSQPDILIMDLLLPDQSGYELLDKIRKSRESKPLPIIIFSQVAHLDDVKASLGLGIAGYFVKGQDSIADIKKLILSLNI